ncbi:3-methyladenine DNA glycosylase [Pseudomonas pergaminensis]|uniref:3-methyladenine DNA glycosylase n=1 Tax=Pseudomonas pergaminensis TaxID=2853159 RepID=A0ABW8QYG0_9PSED
MTARVLGKKFQNISINGALIDVATLIAPENNPNGTVLRSLFVSSGGIVMGATKPTVKSDPGYVRVPKEIYTVQEILVPAGSGVFMYTTVDYSIKVEMSWDVLNADGTVA